MDWSLAIDKNREALKGILVMLVAMIGDRPTTLPRHLHRFLLRLLRPAESAARRLIIVAARGLVVEIAPPRPHKPKPKSIFVRNGVGTGIVRRGSMLQQAATAPRNLSLPLFDPLKRFGRRRRSIKPSAMPRISFFSQPLVPLFQSPRAPNPPPPAPDDLVDAGRLNRRIAALAAALDDLPRQAKRLARWQARRDAAAKRDDNDAARDLRQDKEGQRRAQDAARSQRLSPMRPGRPPGWCRRPTHKVHDVLNEVHGLAVWAREQPDTS